MKTMCKKTATCCITTLFTMLMYFSYADFANAANEPAKTLTTPTPHTQYQLLYSLNAHHAIISLQPNHGNGYQLILQDVHPRAAYQTHFAKTKSGTISIYHFLKIWQKQLAAQQHKDITGDLTGVQVDPSMGHKQFYQVVKLFNPQYQANHDEMTFNVIFTQPDKPANALEEMDNATLFINGCNLCACSADKVVCNYQ